MRNSHPVSTTHEGRRRGTLGWTCAAALGALLLVGGSARAIIPATPIGIIPATPIGIVQDEVGILLVDLQTNGGSKGDIKKATKMQKKVDQVVATDSAAKQLNKMSGVAKIWEKTFPDNSPLGDALTDVGVAVESTLMGARADGASLIPPAAPIGIIPATPIGKRRKDPVKVAQKSVAKGTKFLDKAGTKTKLSQKFKQWAKAAKAMDDFVEASNGNTQNWVVSSVTVAPADQGFDMDGDGTVDNAAAELVDIIAALGGGLDASSVTNLLRAKLEEDRAQAIVPIIQMWGFQTFSNDPLVFGGLMNGVDCDDDVSDNYSGTEEFDVSQTQASDGHPFVRAPTSFDADGDYTLIVDGTYAAQLPIPAGIEFAGLELPGDVPFGVVGNASATANDGLIAIAIPMDRLIGLLDGALPINLPAPAEAAIRALADLDVNGDGTNESMSTALLFESVPCGTSPDCEPGVDTSTTANWVISEVSVAGVGEGEDFTGDGVADNALADLLARIATDYPLIAAQIDFDQFLNDRIAASTQVAMIQIWGINDWDVDNRVYGGVFNANDTDGNAADNFSGNEAFDPGATVDADDHPRASVPDEFTANGQYEIHLQAADLAAAPIQLGLLPVSADAELFLAGTATPTNNDGQLAFTIDPANITQILDDNIALPLPVALQNLIAGFADVPGGLLSVTIDFQSVAAELQ